MGSQSLLQRLFPIQGSNLGFPHCRQILYHVSHQGRRFGFWLLTLNQPHSSPTLPYLPEGPQRPQIAWEGPDINLGLLLFGRWIESNSLWPHWLQPTRLPCPSLPPGVAKTHVRWFGDAIQPFHPLLPTFPLALNLSQYQGVFQWVCSLHQVDKVLELQHQSFQWIFRVDFL